MSYVLDALKKADAERERGSVPGLHAQPVPLSPSLQAAPVAKPWVWTVVGALVAVLACLLVWRLIGRDDAPGAPQVSPATSAVISPNVVPNVAPVAVAPAPAIVPAAPPPANAPQPIVSRAALAATTTARRTTAAPVAVEKPGATVPAPAARMAAPAAPASAPSDSRLPTQAELPDDLKRGLPTLAIGGSIYSDSPAGRFLIINGQIFHEGDKLAPDLVLIQIRLKLAVLSYKGTRFSIAY